MFLITRTATLNDNVRIFFVIAVALYILTIIMCDVPIMSIVVSSISYANHCINIHNLYIITDYFRNYNNNKKRAINSARRCVGAARTKQSFIVRAKEFHVCVPFQWKCLYEQCDHAIEKC